MTTHAPGASAPTVTHETQLITVPFHGATLYVVERDGEPYTPLKSIVEGMGLSWQGQHEKLKANEARWGVRIILIPTDSGKQDALCLPLRKLAGWLMTLHPAKVKPEIREKIAAYQKECDDALWKYWSEGHASRDAAPHPIPTPDIPLLTRGQVGQIVRVINQRATALHGSANEIGRKLLARCQAETYDDIPAWRFEATMKWLKSLTHADVTTHHPSLEEVHSGAIAAAADKEWKLPSGRPGEKWVVAFDAEGKPSIAPYRPPRVLPALMAFNLGRECIGNFSSLSDLGSKTEQALTLHPDNLPHILVTAFRYFADEENLPDIGLFAERLAEYLGDMHRRATHGAMRRGA